MLRVRVGSSHVSWPSIVSDVSQLVSDNSRSPGRKVRYKRAITSEALRQGRGVSVTFFLLGIFRREKSRGALVEILFHRAIGGGSVSRRVKNRADRAEHSTLIDVSNPDRIVRAEINGTRVKKQNTCLCCRSAHRR